MLTTLILLAAVGQTPAVTKPEAPKPQWIKLSNQPGWEGYGTINANGWVVPEKFRRTDNPTVEVPPATDPATGKPVVFTGAVASATNTQPAATEPPATNYADPYGFLSWLNATRAAYGLPAVGHDPNLSSWSAENNNHQAARGMGHFVMGPARRQNVAFGSYASIGSMWMGSRAHRAALLDPSIRWIGIAGLGAYWTFNAN
jgi:uncharacterized protein YkwD